MAERLPVGAARNIKSPPFTASGPSSVASDLSNASIDKLNRPASGLEMETNGSNVQMLPNGFSTTTNRSSAHHKQSHPDALSINGGRTKESESRFKWVEQDEPGVYITLTSLPGGAKDLKRVRFSRKRFSEKQAKVWWAENEARVYEQYNVRMVDKSSVGVGSEDLAN